jgi:hypothetical protein
MQFEQSKKDGSCDIVFSDEEIKVLNKYKKLHFTAESLNTFGNCLMKMVMDWNANFKPELQKQLTKEDDTIDLSKNDTSNK